jgi:hypothetical protein
MVQDPTCPVQAGVLKGNLLRAFGSLWLKKYCHEGTKTQKDGNSSFQYLSFYISVLKNVIRDNNRP